MIKIDVVVKFEEGLHARPTIALASLVKDSKSDVVLIKDYLKVNAGSLLRVLSLCIKENDKISFEINGEDEEEVAKEIQTLFN